MENGIVSKKSLRTSQTRKYKRIYVMIKVWGSLGSIKSIHRVTVSTPLTSNAPSVVSVTVCTFKIGRTEVSNGTVREPTDTVRLCASLLRSEKFIKSDFIHVI